MCTCEREEKVCVCGREKEEKVCERDYSITHGVCCDGDRLVAKDCRREEVKQVGQGRADGGVVLGTDHDESEIRQKIKVMDIDILKGLCRADNF